MSYKLTQDVIDDVETKLSLAEWAVLVVLCRHADDDGGSCYPSLDTLVQKTHACADTVRVALKGLVKKGRVSYTQEPGKKRLYTVALPVLTQGVGKVQGVGNIAGVGNIVGVGKVQGVGNIAPHPSENSNPTPRKNPTRIEQEEIIEENIFSAAPSFDDAVPEPPDDFFLDSYFPDESAPAENKKKPQEKKKVAKKKPATHKFSIETLPDEWRKVCKEMRPDLDPDRVFAHFRFYWTAGKGANTLRCDKSWATSWTNWVLKEREQTSSDNYFKVKEAAPNQFAVPANPFRVAKNEFDEGAIDLLKGVM